MIMPRGQADSLKRNILKWEIFQSIKIVKCFNISISIKEVITNLLFLQKKVKSVRIDYLMMLRKDSKSILSHSKISKELMK